MAGLTHLDGFRASIAAFNRRDLDGALSYFEPDIEWEPYVNDPDAGTYRGREGVRRFWQEWFDAMADFRLRIDECIDAGDGRLVAVTQVRGTGRGSGVPVEATLFQVADTRDGKAYRVRMFGDRSAALKAVGLEE